MNSLDHKILELIAATEGPIYLSKIMRAFEPKVSGTAVYMCVHALMNQKFLLREFDSGRYWLEITDAGLAELKALKLMALRQEQWLTEVPQVSDLPCVKSPMSPIVPEVRSPAERAASRKADAGIHLVTPFVSMDGSGAGQAEPAPGLVAGNGVLPPKGTATNGAFALTLSAEAPEYSPLREVAGSSQDGAASHCIPSSGDLHEAVRPEKMGREALPLNHLEVTPRRNLTASVEHSGKTITTLEAAVDKLFAKLKRDGPIRGAVTDAQVREAEHSRACAAYRVGVEASEQFPEGDAE